MLIRLTVKNYKSFNEETEMPMVSSSKIRMMQEHVIQSDGVKLLKHAAIYGANASGKTNLIDCFRFMRRVLGVGLPLDSTNLYCRNDSENENRKSLFELQISIGERYYAYGFSAVLSQRRIMEEWLYELGASPAVSILERNVVEGAITTDLALDDKTRVRFDTYAEDFADNETGLFLSELNRSKRFDEDSPIAVFNQVFNYIVNRIRVIGPTQPIMTERYHDYLFDQDAVHRIGAILRSFDTGATGIQLVELSRDELVDMVPSPLLKEMIEDMQQRIAEETKSDFVAVICYNESLAIIRYQPSDKLEIFSVKLKHASSRSLFDFSEESDGTRRLFDLIILLLAVDDDMVFIIDELERSLHPMLVRQLLTVFMKLNAQHSAQLVFSTHEASIMSQKLFRRDEIWFVDRGANGDSRLYSLDRFKERFDKDISKAYLEGRYGAVPVFTELNLTEQGDTHAADS